MDPRKFEVLPGDLAAPGLGWDESLRLEVSDRADVILHCGAFVHHLHNYRMMKPANVEGTRELLKLALQTKRKSFAFVSTLTVASAIEGATEAVEAILPNRPMVNSGYILTKWVGEQLVAATARKYGLPSLIARPGNITGSTMTGYTNYSHNHFWLFNKGCVQLGKYPDVDSPSGVDAGRRSGESHRGADAESSQAHGRHDRVDPTRACRGQSQQSADAQPAGVLFGFGEVRISRGGRSCQGLAARPGHDRRNQRAFNDQGILYGRSDGCAAQWSRRKPRFGRLPPLELNSMSTMVLYCHCT